MPLGRWELRLLWLSIPLKLIVAAWVIGRFAPEHGGRFIWGGVGIWGSALVYDGLRQHSRVRLRKRTDGRWDHDPSDHYSIRISRAACLFVGSGYAVRMATALEVGSEGRIPWQITALFAATMFLSEIGTVTMSWIHEGIELLRKGGDERLREKAHLDYLLRESNLRDIDTSDPKAIDNYSIPSGFVPWTISGSIGFILAAVAAASASSGMGKVDNYTLIVVAAAGTLAAVQCIVRLGSPIGYILAIGLMTLTFLWRGFDYPWLGPSLFLLLAMVYFITERGDYTKVVGWWDDIKKTGMAIVGPAALLARRTAHWLRGGWSAEELAAVLKVKKSTPPPDVFVRKE